MVAFLIKTVTKVLLAATYVLCNGALVAPIGTSQIGCIAQQNQIPVVVVCETYKFADRVNLDQINNNEQGSAQKFKSNYLRGEQKGPSKLEVQLINLRYDLTPLKYLSMIVCEIGNIPPHSVPVVIREIMDYEDQHSDEELLSDDEDESSDNLSSEMKEQDEQDEEDEEPVSK
jgi:translation initiation factor eIF-2B subunit delta